MTSNEHNNAMRDEERDSTSTLQDAPQTGHDAPNRHASNTAQIVVAFEPHDPTNPYNWSQAKKIYILLTGVLVVLNSTLGSSLPAGITPFFPQIFGISAENTSQLTLPVTTYLLGYVVAPLVFGPASEQYGRRPLMLYTFLGFFIWTLACALAPNFAALVIFRFFAGICASAPITVTGGLYADIYSDPISRGRAMAAFMASTAFGPTAIAPIISGFLGPIWWRWPFWTALAIAGASLPPLLLMPETYGPIILVKKARKLRKASPDTKYVAPFELESGNWQEIVTKVLTRPVRMFFTENMVLFTCIYTALVYAIFYLNFEAYDYIFQEMYGLDTGTASLAFLPIAVGSLLSFPIFMAYDAFLRRAQKQKKSWTRRYEARRLPIAFIGGPMISVSMFWLSWTSFPTISPWVPALSGLPYGAGFVLIYMALLNYLTDAYEIYASSALAAASCTRSILGAVLPLAAGKMYGTLGIQWATSLLAFCSVVCLIIPIAFWVWGRKLRAGSKFAGEIMAKREKQEREEREREKRQCENGEKHPGQSMNAEQSGSRDIATALPPAGPDHDKETGIEISNRDDRS